jgi:hypothetical protein
MAGEGAIKFGWPTAGLATITAEIHKPDDSVRETIALEDTGHAKLYTNTVASAVVAGDSVLILVGTALVGNDEYLPAVTAVAGGVTLATIEAKIDTLLTDGQRVVNVVADPAQITEVAVVKNI